MSRYVNKVHKVTDFLLPWALIMLLMVLFIDLFFNDFYYRYEIYFLILNYSSLSIFVLDLLFKFHRAKTTKIFFKKNWLDVLATLPFFLVFRIFEALNALLVIVDIGTISQEAVGIAREAQREGRIIIRSARLVNFRKFLKDAIQNPKRLHTLHFFDKPK